MEAVLLCDLNFGLEEIAERRRCEKVGFGAIADDASIARCREVFASLMQEIGPIQYEFAL